VGGLMFGLSNFSVIAIAMLIGGLVLAALILLA
jgi:hypothetical protein